MAITRAYPSSEEASTWPTLHDASGPARVDERLVWWIWQTRRFDSSAARASGFDVVFPGWPSTTAGPDFRDAIIGSTNGSLRRGDVEIHTFSSDWTAHRHHLDPAYDNVVLHVVLSVDQLIPPSTSTGRSLDQLELAGILTASLALLEHAFDGRPTEIVRCPADTMDTEKIQETVETAGRLRFADKVMRIRSDVEALGPNEALYRLIAECLGYSANQYAFRKIAESIPFDLLSSLSLFEAERLLLTAAGIATDQFTSPFIDEPVLKPGELKAFRVRPANHPAARLRALARLTHRHRRGFSNALEGSRTESLAELFLVESDQILVGQQRALDIVVNVGLPYLTAYSNLDGAATLAGLPAAGDNRWVSGLRSKLAKDGFRFRPYRALQQQGLLHLSLHFCRFDHCEACPLHGEAETAEPSTAN